MSEASFASLNPALLARKGGAKPAMRPQLHSLPDVLPDGEIDDTKLEDLGWNDMGQDSEAQDKPSAEVFHLTPAAANEDPEEDFDERLIDAHADKGTAIDAAQPIVKRQQQVLAERVTAKPKPVRKKSVKVSGKRAAFTLRLDTERHMKLRLAATMQGKSAQSVVTEALDALLEQIDDLDALAQRMQRT
ncbi:MAG: hypothetical protein AAGK02_07645 [Pseudomonadota bacterium]